MGLGSSLKKGLKKISKGLKKVGHIGAAFVKIHKKVWKEVKRAWNTKLGRALLIGAAIWATGGLLAMKFGIAQGMAAFSPANVLAGFSQAGSVIAGKLGMEGLSAQLAVPGAETAAAAGVTTTGGAAGVGTMEVGGMTASIPSAAPGTTALMTPAQVGATEAAAAKAAGAAPGLLESAGSFAATPGGGLVTYGAMQMAGNAIAAHNTPTQAEEHAAMLRANQRANDLSRFGAPPAVGSQSAQFVTPAIGQPMPGLLEEPTYGAG